MGKLRKKGQEVQRDKNKQEFAIPATSSKKCRNAKYYFECLILSLLYTLKEGKRERGKEEKKKGRLLSAVMPPTSLYNELVMEGGGYKL